MLDSIKTKKYLCKQENGCWQPMVPVLHLSRPVWDCPNGWLSHFCLISTCLTHIHNSCTHNTDGATNSYSISTILHVLSKHIRPLYLTLWPWYTFSDFADIQLSTLHSLITFLIYIISESEAFCLFIVL